MSALVNVYSSGKILFIEQIKSVRFDEIDTPPQSRNGDTEELNFRGLTYDLIAVDFREVGIDFIKLPLITSRERSFPLRLVTFQHFVNFL